MGLVFPGVVSITFFHITIAHGAIIVTHYHDIFFLLNPCLKIQTFYTHAFPPCGRARLSWAWDHMHRAIVAGLWLNFDILIPSDWQSHRDAHGQMRYFPRMREVYSMFTGELCPSGGQLVRLWFSAYFDMWSANFFIKVYLQGSVHRVEKTDFESS